MKKLATFVVAGALLLGPLPASAGGREHPSTATHVGLGLGTALANLVYGPAKILYATAGSLTAGLAWCLTGGRTDVARAILIPSVRGDYFLSPQNLTLEEPFRFTGSEYGDSGQEAPPADYEPAQNF